MTQNRNNIYLAKIERNNTDGTVFLFLRCLTPQGLDLQKKLSLKGINLLEKLYQSTKKQGAEFNMNSLKEKGYLKTCGNRPASRVRVKQKLEEYKHFPLSICGQAVIAAEFA